MNRTPLKASCHAASPRHLQNACGNSFSHAPHRQGGWRCTQIRACACGTTAHHSCIAQESCYGERLSGVGGNTLVTTALWNVRSWVWFSYRSIFTLDVTSVRRSGWWWRRRISGTPMSSPLLPLHCKIATRHTVQTSKPTNRTTSSSSLEGSGLVL